MTEVARARGSSPEPGEPDECSGARRDVDAVEAAAWDDIPYSVPVLRSNSQPCMTTDEVTLNGPTRRASQFVTSMMNRESVPLAVAESLPPMASYASFPGIAVLDDSVPNAVLAPVVNDNS